MHIFRFIKYIIMVVFISFFALADEPIGTIGIIVGQADVVNRNTDIEIKDNTVSQWSCVPEYKRALEKSLGKDALEKFEIQTAQNMSDLNNYSTVLYKNFRNLI